MSIGTILLIVLVLILLGVLPVWPHARSWGYRPSGSASTARDHRQIDAGSQRFPTGSAY
jgi:hypothetical protein